MKKREILKQEQELQSFADEIEINEEPKAQLQIAPASSNNKKQKKKEKENNFKERTITVNGKPHPTSFSPNVIRNQKYNIVTFVPYTLWEQFKYFINFYYLIISLSQFIPVLQVGFLFTYVSPLAFVVILAMCKEAYDDIKRMLRDKVANSEMYYQLTETSDGLRPIKSSQIKVGQFIQVHKDQRIPADLLLLRTTGELGSSFIRTDQLDGETDWKLRRAVSKTQKLGSDYDLFKINASIYAEKPRKDIYKFLGNFSSLDDGQVEPLSLDNTLWANTVLASDTIIGLVLYTGKETRSVLNTSSPSNKKGAIDVEVNRLTIVLCIIQVVISFALVFGGLFKGIWWLNFFRFIVLVSSIIPISMRVNLDFAKLVYAFLIMNDPNIPGCTVRNTGIPEDLGRISFLLTDKTGTLTQNDMIFKKLHLGNLNFGNDTLEEINQIITDAYHSHSIRTSGENINQINNINEGGRSLKLRAIKEDKSTNSKVLEAIKTLALCHNVTPHEEEDQSISYQASSPDEIALVKFTEKVGLRLHHRTLNSITLLNPLGDHEKNDFKILTREGKKEYDILENFPFTSERKRMGIIVRNKSTSEIKYLMKGADAVMAKIVQDNDWLEEECGNLAREGLRTLVFGFKSLSDQEYLSFQSLHHAAQTSIENRDENIERAINTLEEELELLCLTGVEDKLQESVKNTLESLRNAAIKVWMLTGDKRETATCIGISTKLISKNDTIYHIESQSPSDLEAKLIEYSQMFDTVLVIDGHSLQLCLDHFPQLFFDSAVNSPSVVCCRCSPTQKADVVELIKTYSKGSRTAAIGDGGNDVSMIQAAHVGIGIVGKEGKQASLASDYSIDQFSHVKNLLLWHGRNSYLRSSVIAQLVIHRGLIISIMQAIFSAVFYMSPTVLYTGMLLFGYSCWYTMAPIFAFVSDRDVDEESAFLYPELYIELRKGRALNDKTFLFYCLLAFYQAAVITILPIVGSLLNYENFMGVTFTALIFVELVNISIKVERWSTFMTTSLLFTFALYPLFVVLLPGYYELTFVSNWRFWFYSVVLTFFACFPLFLLKLFVNRFFPHSTSKLLK